MTRPLRILHTADSHIGADLPARPRSSRPRRGDDLVSSFERVLERAIPEEIDLVIHAGDLFDTPRPSSRALVAASRPLRTVAERGIPVIIVPGNHERSAIPSAIFLAHENIHIVTEPRTMHFRLQGARVSVTAFPCLRRAADKKFATALAACEWESSRADVRILAVHQTFDSAACGPANYRFRSGDNVIDRDAIPEAFDYVAAGHIHRHQKLTAGDANERVVYAGSPDRISFAEIDEPKGYVIAELSGQGLIPTFIEQDVRPMLLQSIDVTDLSCENILGRAETILDGLPSRAVAQLRLTGTPGRENLRGLRLSQMAGARRPDVLFHVVARAVDFQANSVRTSHKQRLTSVFANDSSRERETMCGGPADLGFLPTKDGVYAMYDGDGRLLYIGKSKSLRTRVRSHFRDSNKRNHFGGWTGAVTRIEAQRAHSELEALLVEAQLIQRCKPPFNRQMRGSAKYCYLCENGLLYYQLSISSRPLPQRTCFGPYRSKFQAHVLNEALAVHFGTAMCPKDNGSNNALPLLKDTDANLLCNRFYMNLCCGPCASRIPKNDYAARIRQRNDLLSGVDDTSVIEVEQILERRGDDHGDDAAVMELERRIATLRAAFEHGALLREAEGLLGGMLVLPGEDESRTIALMTRAGAMFRRLRWSKADAMSALGLYRAQGEKDQPSSGSRLPTFILDSFCIVVRELRKENPAYRFIPASDLHHVSPNKFLKWVFE